MKASDTFFDGRRFLSLFKKEWKEGWKKNLMFTIVLLGMFAAWFLFMGYNMYSYGPRRYIEDRVWEPMLAMLLPVFFIGACMSASCITGTMKNKTGKLSVMMLPATPFEKFITRWLIYTIGFLAVLPVTFLLADWIRFSIYSAICPETVKVELFPFWDILMKGTWDETALNRPNFVNPTPLMLTSCWALQSFFVLGSTLWQKSSFLKTAVALFCIVIALWLFGYWLVELFVPSGFYIPGSKFENMPEVSEETAMDLAALFLSLIALFNTVLAYFRYKEMEVINRW